MQKLFENIVASKSDNIPTYKLLINGRWESIAGDGFIDVLNPARDEIVGRVPVCGKKEVERSIDAARDGVGHSEFPPVERLNVMGRAAELLEQNFETMARTITLENGKPISQANHEVETTIQRLRLVREEARVLYGEYIPGEWVADTQGKFAIVQRNPIGIVAAISPFNYPLFIGAAKIIPALVAGNAVVVKPASATPLSMVLFCRLLQEAGVPPATLQVVTGSGSEIGKIFTASPHIDVISFTGSTAAGHALAGSAGMKKLHLELGGKAAAIVLEDADIELAAAQICKGTFKNSGQRCDAVSRVLVAKKVRKEFIEAVVECSKQYTPGNPLDPETTMGPLIDMNALERVDEKVNDAINNGANVVVGGKYDALFYEPTILDQVVTEMKIATEEIFGPVMPVISVESHEQALEISNSSEYGLDSCLFTCDINRALELAAKLQDGSVTINAAPSHGSGHFPFGGNKKSGMGREGLKYSIDELTRLHTIVVHQKL